MNSPDPILKDREHRLRVAIESLKRRTPHGEKPPDAVVPTWDGRGGMICPKCGGRCVTPVAPNPYRAFQEEKMVLVPGKVNVCPHGCCGADHYVTEELAWLHNSFYYPEDYRESRKPKREDG